MLQNLEEASMAKIDIPEDILAKLGKLARPFVDKEPADVIRWLVEEREPEEADTELKYSSLAPPDLSHTKILSAKINGEPVGKANWNRLMDFAIMLAANTLNDVDALSKIVLAKHVKGQKTDQGFDYIPSAKISVQGQDANSAWKTTAHILHELGCKAEVMFSWYDNPKAAKPGEIAKLVVT
jgi:hypothetical protein